MQNYRIVESRTADGLSEQVNIHLEAGWECLGGIAYTSTPYTGISVHRAPVERFMQAMVQL